MTVQVEEAKELAEALQLVGEAKAREEVEEGRRAAEEMEHRRRGAVEVGHKDATVAAAQQDTDTTLEALTQRPIEGWSREDVVRWAESLVLPAEWKALLTAGLANDETDGEDLVEMTAKRIEKKLCKGLDAEAASRVIALRDQVAYTSDLRGQNAYTSHPSGPLCSYGPQR